MSIPYPNGKGPNGKAVPHNAPLAEAHLAKLNNTQQVIVALLRQLPTGQYHVFLNNLFSSTSLFTYLHTYLNYAATGTAHQRSGVNKALLALKKLNSTQDHIP